MDRVGRTYISKPLVGLVCTVAGSKRMSAGTWRHRMVVIVASETHNASFNRVGAFFDWDEVPVDPFESHWTELSA